MNLFSRIAIGTANWGKEYNGAKVPEKDIEKILGYAQCVGIDMLDCATAYGWDWNQANSYFHKVIKINENDTIRQIQEIAEPNSCYCLMAHNRSFWSQTNKYIFGNLKGGVSIYEKSELDYDLLNYPGFKPYVIQMPYSLYDRRFEDNISSLKFFGCEIHVRSIFLRGRIIADGVPAEECIKFVLANPYIDRIIIGADSFDQFRNNLDFIIRWNNKEKHDENLLDPRKWKIQ